MDIICSTSVVPDLGIPIIKTGFLPDENFRLPMLYFINLGCVFFNLEKSPVFRKGTIEIYNSYSKKFIDKIEVKSCHASVIEIDQYNFDKDDLPVFISRDIVYGI